MSLKTKTKQSWSIIRETKAGAEADAMEEHGLALHGFLRLLSYASQGHLQGVALATMG